MTDAPEMPYMRMDESLLDYAMRFNEFVEGWNRAQTPEKPLTVVGSSEGL